MNSLEYELDSVGGLMPQILALTAPPGNRDNRQPLPDQQQSTHTSSGNHQGSNGNGQSKSTEVGLAAHPYFRRPGRGHNHDSCDACSEGGDLICCDLCPASFHLTCHDPPLDEDEIPMGEWACHQCRMGGNEDEKASCSSTKSVKVCTKGVKRKDRDREEAAKKDESKKVCAGGREFAISDTPLSTLIKAAAIINPTQFTLPYELTLPANFPGEPKETMRKNGSRRGMPKKKPYELDNGLVPLPAKLCFQCNKSCRTGPLIPCDFCPLFFHLDCLDPPLTTPPMGRWMCPNHPEQIVDTLLLTSHSLTERVKLWDKFSLPVDQHAVKLNFLHRCHRLNPPFRFKVKKALRSRIRVPTAVKAHYRDPPDLLPHLSPSQYLPIPPPYTPHTDSEIHNSTTKLKAYIEPRILQSVEDTDGNTHIVDNKGASVKEKIADSELLTRIAETDTQECLTKAVQLEIKESSSFSSDKPTREEKDQWLSGLLSLQSSIIKHMSTNGSYHPKPIENNIKKQQQVNGFSPDGSSRHLLDQKANFMNGDITSHESKPNKLCVDGRTTQLNHISSNSSQQYQSKAGFKSQRTKHFSNLKSRYKKSSHSEVLSDTLSNLNLLLKERLESDTSVTLSSLEQSVVEVLAYERLKEILEPEKPTVVLSTPPLPARALVCPLVPDIRLKDLAPKNRTYSSEPVPMTYRILKIGRGSQNHVNLELYGHCNYVSTHHASILFDEMTGHYELLNYSEYCTKVDGVTYHCDFNEKTVSQAVPPPILQQIKDIIAERRGAPPFDREPVPISAMSSRPGEDFVRCQCRWQDMMCYQAGKLDDSGASGGWEGAAVLHHGSYLKFGCQQFVFSIVEEASKGDWAEDTLATYEKFLKKDLEEREEDEYDEAKVKKEKDGECREKKGKKEEKNVVKS